MTEPETDSLITGLTTAVNSRKGRTLLAASWPYLLAAATFVGGLVVRSMQLEPRMVAMESRMDSRLDKIAKDTSATRRDVLELKTTGQQQTIRIGRQAAYATAGFEAFEPPKLKAQKRAWAEKYAAAFERLVTTGDHLTVDAAYVALFKDVAVP